MGVGGGRSVATYSRVSFRIFVKGGGGEAKVMIAKLRGGEDCSSR